MPTALVPLLFKRIILRPDPPRSPWSGCTLSTGRRKCSSKRRFRMSMNLSPAPQSWATVEAASFLPQVVRSGESGCGLGAELGAILLSPPEAPQPSPISLRLRATLISQRCPPAKDAIDKLIADLPNRET